MAVLAAGALFGVSTWVLENVSDTRTLRLARGLRHAVAAEVVVGVTNIWLAAPGWLQLVHLLVAQLLWTTAVLVTASAWAAPRRA